MKFKLRPDKEANEWGLYEMRVDRRVCGIYIRPERGYTNLFWWSKDDSLPGRIDTADFDAVKLLVMTIAEGAGEWK